jgi:two-component system secretion response regulator SsrB
MESQIANCVVLADRHPGLTEGLRGLLEPVFKAVIMVADEISLLKACSQLQPEVAVVDLSLAHSSSLVWLRHLCEGCSGMKVVVLGVHDEQTVRQAVLAAGASAYVLKRNVGQALLPAIDVLLAEKHRGAHFHGQEQGQNAH